MKRLEKFESGSILYEVTETMLRGGAVVARQAHNLKAVGSIPAPATNEIQELTIRKFLFFTLKLRKLQQKRLGFPRCLCCFE